MSGVLPRSRQRFWKPVATTDTSPADPRGPATSPRVSGLRPRRPKDVAATARLMQVVFFESGYPLEWPDAPRAWLTADDVLAAWVVERQGEILGHVAVSRVGHDTVSAYRWREMTGRDPSELAAVSRLFVRPRVRRQGIGGALMDTAVADIRARGVAPVLQVANTQQDAIRLYASRDWRLLSMDLWGARTEHRRMHCYAAPPAGVSRG